MEIFKTWSFTCLFLLGVLLNIALAEVERVDDSDLMHLLTSEDNVVVLFTKDNCAQCEALENVAEKSQEKFKEYLQATLVKSHNSQLLPIYNPSKQESLIYFRKGIPLLYYGELKEQDILQVFSENQEPISKELSDETFEHLTQAATGGTTGDWLIFFSSNDCHLCHRLYAVWEAVGSKIKHRLNIARVNRLESGISTAKRFGITKSPEFIFIRHGKFYRYKNEDYSPKSFIEFVEGGYQKTNGVEVPPLAGLLNEVLEKYLQFAGKHTHLIKMGTIGVSIVSGVLFIAKRLFSSKPKAISKSKKTG